jgi:hypothetical protein
VRRFIYPLVVILSLAAAAETSFKATTTLTAETAKNSSAALAFAGQSNGNMVPGNISKVPTRTLLYTGSTTKLYAHLMPWFGFGDHVDIGYVSSDVLQVQKQVTDMVSRGLDGAIIDWYGRGESKRQFLSYEQASQAVMHEAEQHTGFSFAIMLDAGALRHCNNPGGCDATQTVIDDLNYAERTYENSPAYLRYNNHPVVLFFGEEAYSIDWRQVHSKVAGDPLFIFRNAGAFRHSEAQGGFSWVSPLQSSERDRMALTYLENFYKMAVSHKDSYSLGTGYKGFDDSIALWTAHRFIDQQCGQTWLASISDANSHYSVDDQMMGMQLVTWNDYEEGTEFEGGISNCVALSASAGGSVLSWRITGDPTTIDHFTVFVSTDGENLMPLADVAADVQSLDLARFGLDQGQYTVYVKAVGKPSLTNTMSAPQRISIAAPRPGAHRGPSVVLSVSPNTGQAPSLVNALLLSGSAQLLPQKTVIDFGDGTVTVGQTNAAHTYNLTGVYTVMATVTDVNGNSSTVTVLVTVDGITQAVDLSR